MIVKLPWFCSIDAKRDDSVKYWKTDYYASYLEEQRKEAVINLENMYKAKMAALRDSWDIMLID